MLRGWATVTLRDLTVEYTDLVRQGVGLRLESCREVTVGGCGFEGATIDGALLLLDDMDRALIMANQFEAVDDDNGSSLSMRHLARHPSDIQPYTEYKAPARLR